jgi:hypothetical protein
MEVAREEAKKTDGPVERWVNDQNTSCVDTNGLAVHLEAVSACCD